MAYRAIVDNLNRSVSLARVGDTARSLFFYLLAQSDPYGQLNGMPAKVRAQCFPLLDWTDAQVGAAMAELEHVRRIWVYEAEGVVTIQIVDFEDNQPGEFLRRRGARKLPEPESAGLKSGSCTDYSRSLYETPANEHVSGTTPGGSGTTPSPKEVKAREASKAAAERRAHEPARTRAREGDPEGTPPQDAAALNDMLEKLGVHEGLRVAAHQDIPRATACATKALAAANGNPAGYFRTLLETGDWPTPATPTAEPLEPVELVRRLIRNGVITDLTDLEAELTEHPDLTPDDRRQLRHAVTGEPPLG